jgi:hypothetical protein
VYAQQQSRLIKLTSHIEMVSQNGARFYPSIGLGRPAELWRPSSRRCEVTVNLSEPVRFRRVNQDTELVRHNEI